MYPRFQARLEKKKKDLETLKRRLTWSKRLDEEEAMIKKEERELFHLLKEKGAEMVRRYLKLELHRYT